MNGANLKVGDNVLLLNPFAVGDQTFPVGYKGEVVYVWNMSPYLVCVKLDNFSDFTFFQSDLQLT